MVTGRERWLGVLRPLGLLVLFVAVIRGLPQQTQPPAEGIDCESTAPSSDRQTATLERCIELHPDDVELMMDLGRTYEAAGQWDRAEALYRRALTVDPDDGDAHVRLGEMLLRRGDLAGAAREGAVALEIQPGGMAAQALVKRAQLAAPGTAQ